MKHRISCCRAEGILLFSVCPFTNCSRTIVCRGSDFPGKQCLSHFGSCFEILLQLTTWSALLLVLALCITANSDVGLVQYKYNYTSRYS